MLGESEHAQDLNVANCALNHIPRQQNVDFRIFNRFLSSAENDAYFI